MCSIEIRKISITDLEVDAIVNAANDGLWAGGGVCGAILLLPDMTSFRRHVTLLAIVILAQQLLRLHLN